MQNQNKHSNLQDTGLEIINQFRNDKTKVQHTTGCN